MYYYTEDDDRTFRAQYEAAEAMREKDRVIYALQDKLKTARAEATKEYAEILKSKFSEGEDVMYLQALIHQLIDNTVMETVGNNG